MTINVTKENFSVNTSSDSEEDKVTRNQTDNMRRSKRKNIIEVGFVTGSGRRVNYRIPDEHEGTSSRSKRLEKSKISHRTSRRKLTKSKKSKPRGLPHVTQSPTFLG